MQSLTLCLSSSLMEQPFVLASQRLGLSLRTVQNVESLDFAAQDSDWTIVYGSMENVQNIAQRCIRQGKNPRTHLIRVIDQAWEQYFFHDLPIFASVVIPKSEADAIHLLRKLAKAKDFAQPVAAAPAKNNQQASAVDWIRASPQLAVTLNNIYKIATKPVDILMFGETGSGKDMLAKHIHQVSLRKGNFVHINCAALPDQLIESELFGVEAGAYTGATRSRPGKIELADGGTLYLDEIDSMSLVCQAKLLTTLQERGAERLGGNKFVKSSFRVIASTKIDLTEQVSKGLFRQDLLFRIEVVTLPIPPLRQRMEDIPLLFELFCQESAKLYECETPDIPPEIRAALLMHDWPGNVRELKASAERFVLGMPLTRTKVDESTKAHPGLKVMLKEYEKRLIEQALSANDQVVAKAAEALRMTPHNLYYRIKQIGIRLSSAEVDKAKQSDGIASAASQNR
ncbi:MAG: sigma 54-interacting transcriptional regulator [Burkholderiaceae bacterium]